ncbi:hypothetical protein AVEN_255301-1 [Araneus ventricosus]|uniref:Uncharacterized protein n=1 Tax=Araneus ventricosus TaxID=182803 RepID=A0A4Y2BA12_ARAVE|nr:hypothetical protein AVEN_255301-1 [Araneus ventricosus]
MGKRILLRSTKKPLILKKQQYGVALRSGSISEEFGLLARLTSPHTISEHGFLKDKVYRTRPVSVPDLKDSIHRMFRIFRQTLFSAVGNVLLATKDYCSK